MNVSRVFGDIAEDGDSTDDSRSYMMIVRPRIQEELSIDETMERRILSRSCDLQSHPWNGHLEMTDECRMGLAVLNVVDEHGSDVQIAVQIRNYSELRRVLVVPVVPDLKEFRFRIFSRRGRIQIPDQMLRFLDSFGVERFISESRLINSLFTKIERSSVVASRWIPRFAPSFHEINSIINLDISETLRSSSFGFEEGYKCIFHTLGQWLYTLLIERVRRRLPNGISLRVLLYCICWCTRVIREKEMDIFRDGAVIIKTWILSDTCHDCLYKSLRCISSRYASEYLYDVADSFSEFITIPNLHTSIQVLPCGETKPSAALNKRGFIRTISVHSYLSSPTANSLVKVDIRYGPRRKLIHILMTARQVTSFLVVLDIHSRVLRAIEWSQTESVYASCLAERRANDGQSQGEALTQIVEDLLILMKNSREMKNSISHLLLLILKGKLSRDLFHAYKAYKNRNRDANLSSNSFIVEYIFTRCPSTEMLSILDHLTKKFDSASKQQKVMMLSYSINYDTRGYTYGNGEYNIQEKYNISDSMTTEDLMTVYNGETLVFKMNNSHALERGTEDRKVSPSASADNNKIDLKRRKDLFNVGLSEKEIDTLNFLNTSLGLTLQLESASNPNSRTNGEEENYLLDNDCIAEDLGRRITPDGAPSVPPLSIVFEDSINETLKIESDRKSDDSGFPNAAFANHSFTSYREATDLTSSDDSDEKIECSVEEMAREILRFQDHPPFHMDDQVIREGHQINFNLDISEGEQRLNLRKKRKEKNNEKNNNGEKDEEDEEKEEGKEEENGAKEGEEEEMTGTKEEEKDRNGNEEMKIASFIEPDDGSSVGNHSVILEDQDI